VWQISAALSVALVVSLGGFKLYYNQAEAEKELAITRLAQSISNQKTLEQEISGQNQQIEDLLKNQENTLRQISSLEVKRQEAELEVTKIRTTFARHDLNDLSLRKPKLIEKIINKGTLEVLNDLENITTSSID
jgi:septal ring factor EnvC (AmiA/AmiB activator)